MKKVYLAGPITGLSWPDAEDWRNEIKQKAKLQSDKFGHVQFFSPLRGKEYLACQSQIKQSYPEYTLSTSKSILLRDHHDVITSDALIANFMNAENVSIGTVMEIAWAYQKNIPTIVLMNNKNIHSHPMILEAAWWKVGSIEKALQILSTVFNP